jgi:MFS family permease
MTLELVAGRLVARHVGGSLIVWTSVIGIMLGGICLGNVLGGRLADRIEPAKALGPLYALGAALVVACLWMNALIGVLPGLNVLPWDLKTIVVVTLDFLVPTTVLGMIGPVVAKMAVEQSRKAGSALGDVYMLGAVGSIVGTFITGFYLIFLAPTSVIVSLVAVALLFISIPLSARTKATATGLTALALLLVGSIAPLFGLMETISFQLGSFSLNAVALLGHLATFGWGVIAVVTLKRLRNAAEPATDVTPVDDGPPVNLRDLAVLSFLASLGFMAVEMVAGRLVTRHLGSSVFGWTSVIGVLLGGLSIGNFLGGKIADRVRTEKGASWLFMAASMLVLFILLSEIAPHWLIRNPLEHWIQGKPAVPLAGATGSFLSQAIGMKDYSWWFRVLFWTTIVFLLPAIAMGTVSPVVAKLAVDRSRAAKRTGAAIGQVYAWGMVGSILGTFLTGFFLINLLGTKGVILVIATVMALAATALGSVGHAVWAGIPLGLCVIAFVPLPNLQRQAAAWGVRENRGDLSEKGGNIAFADESNYYYIKVEDSPDAEGQMRTLVLDNLIHGYFIIGHPERLDYDYEHIYGLITHRMMAAKAGKTEKAAVRAQPLHTLFLGGGSYTFPRYLQALYPKTISEVAEIDPAVTHANHVALALPKDDPAIKTTWGDARQFVEKNRTRTDKFDIIFGDAFNDFSVPWHLTTKEFNDKIYESLSDDGIYMINIIDIYRSDDQARIEAKEHKRDPARAVADARRLGGFLSSWVETAKQTFEHIYVFGTDETGAGLRETFVVVASKKPIDVKELGSRDSDPQFFQHDTLFEPRPYDEKDMAALKLRSRGIILTDDYAPVENLLAPVAETRGDE